MNVECTNVVNCSRCIYCSDCELSTNCVDSYNCYGSQGIVGNAFDGVPAPYWVNNQPIYGIVEYRQAKVEFNKQLRRG